MPAALTSDRWLAPWRLPIEVVMSGRVVSLVPGFACGANDVIVGVKDAVREPSLAQVQPGVCHGIEFGARENTRVGGMRNVEVGRLSCLTSG
jgi:hypothetical protein